MFWQVLRRSSKAFFRCCFLWLIQRIICYKYKDMDVNDMSNQRTKSGEWPVHTCARAVILHTCWYDTSIPADWGVKVRNLAKILCLLLVLFCFVFCHSQRSTWNAWINARHIKLKLSKKTLSKAFQSYCYAGQFHDRPMTKLCQYMYHCLKLSLVLFVDVVAVDWVMRSVVFMLGRKSFRLFGFT